MSKNGPFATRRSPVTLLVSEMGGTLTVTDKKKKDSNEGIILLGCSRGTNLRDFMGIVIIVHGEEEEFSFPYQ